MSIVNTDIMKLLIAVEKVWDDHLEAHADTDLQYWFPLGITVTANDEFVATLYEEGWNFDDPKKEAK